MDITQRDASEDRIDGEIGARIRDLRIGRGLSQADLAARVGITYQQMHKYERAFNRISVSRLYTIAAALGVSPATIFDGVTDAAREEPPTEMGRFALEIARTAASIKDESKRLALGHVVRALAS